jgi:serine/threonine-protein kinase
MTLPPGSRLGPYEILAPIGAGGMGEVYRAKDTRLGREVAVKVLPEEFFEGEERRQRFEREAKLLASLNHPNIAAIYSFEEIPSSSSSSASRHLLVMELVEGDDLARKISAGPLPFEEALSLARQIAEALAAAHAKGIVHRDLKPANVRVTPEGRVKLLDFGLAKREERDAVASERETATGPLTRDGVVLGTVPYMSPEQARGRRVDERTDVWAFGCVLYEMLAGKRAFDGDSAPDVLAAILLKDPDYAALPGETPGKIRDLLGRCLRREAKQRLHDIAEARLELGELFATTSPAGRSPSEENRRSSSPVSIAVLPFADMSAAKDQEHLCEGMAEEIMNALVGAGIRVAARTSTFHAGRRGDDLPAVARALNVGHVLEGSVRTAGPRMRVTARLTDASSGFQMWSQTFDREAVDVFAVQDEIAAGVLDAVKSRLGASGAAPHARPPVRNLEAYQSYLMGRHLRYTKNDHGGALRAFERALELDPAHAPAWVGVAEASVLAATYGLEPATTAYARARAALATAARLQGETGDARYVEGLLAVGERRWEDGLRAAARASEIEPGHVAARCWLGMFQCIQGRTEDALETLRHAREIDPLSPYPYGMTGMCLLQSRRWEEARTFLDQALAFDAANGLALWVSGAANVVLGRFDVAIAHLERAADPAHRAGFIYGALGWALAAAGRTDEARRVLADLRARAAPAPAVLSEAWLLAALGKTDSAFEVLGRLLEEKNLVAIFTGLPGFDPLREDPRFQAFLGQLRLPGARR